MTSNEIRASFLKYFAGNGHRVVSSSPLVPADDPTLLFTNAGMNQFKDVFLGTREARLHAGHDVRRRCMRSAASTTTSTTSDRRCVTTRSSRCSATSRSATTSRREAIELAWTLLTDVWKMPPDRLVVSVFKGEGGIPRDDEAYEIWRRFVPAERILELGSDDNFWQMGDTGPCGRCSRSTTFAAPATIRRSKSGTTCSWSSSAAPTAR